VVKTLLNAAKFVSENRINTLVEVDDLTAAIDRGKAQALISNNAMTDAQLQQTINNLQSQIDAERYALFLEQYYSSLESAAYYSYTYYP